MQYYFIRICSWCGKDLPNKPCEKESHLKISHTICRECAEKMLEEKE